MSTELGKKLQYMVTSYVLDYISRRMIIILGCVDLWVRNGRSSIGLFSTLSAIFSKIGGNSRKSRLGINLEPVLMCVYTHRYGEEDAYNIF